MHVTFRVTLHRCRQNAIDTLHKRVQMPSDIPPTQRAARPPTEPLGDAPSVERMAAVGNLHTSSCFQLRCCLPLTEGVEADTTVLDGSVRWIHIDARGK